MDAKDSSGQARVLISRSALLHNGRTLRRTVGPSVKICAMVKADAYGHGASTVVDALVNFGGQGIEPPAVDAVAVATMEEAADLNGMSGDVPTLILRPVENIYLGRQRQLLEQAISADWTLTIVSLAAAGDVARVAMNLGKRAAVQIMADTGLSREGCPAAHLPGLYHGIESMPSLKLTGLCTHFANSEDSANEYTADQLRRFRSATESFAAANPRLTRHAANSGATFFSKQSHLDMVRPGIALYGVDPTCTPSVERPLRPAMRWTAPLLLVRDVRKGTSAGYGQTWVADRDTRLGLVPVGYADGYLRAFSNRAVMLLHGKPAPVVGRVSMDYATIDLANIPMASVGDEVTVMDADPLSPCSVYKLAEWADTIPYEIFTRIGQRVARVAVEPGEPSAAANLPGQAA